MNTAGRTLQVLYDDRIVGTLALTSNYKVAFSYADSWLEDGFSISPFSLPLKRGVFVPKKIILMDCMEYFQTAFLMRGDNCC